MVLATLWAVCDTAVASHPNKTFVVFNLLFVFLPMLHSLQDISFPNRDQTQPLAVKVQSPIYLTSKEVPCCDLLLSTAVPVTVFQTVYSITMVFFVCLVPLEFSLVLATAA